VSLTGCFISDTHEQEEDLVLPEADILFHCGDITYRGKPRAIANFANWLKAQPHRYKVVIFGNHDLCGENEDREVCLDMLREAGAIYLENSAVEIEGVKIYGSPVQPWFYDWAFNVRRGPEIAAVWARIPDDTQVLLTHGPPYDILDETKRGDKPGCEDLLRRIWQLKQLRIHAFGHIHEGYGVLEKNGVKFINAAVCNAQYAPVNPPIVVEI
jgi:Icc-related predicted phosphoesterase